MFKSFILLLLLSQFCFALKFKNLCSNCDVKATDIKFDGYTLIVNAENESGSSIPAGSVTLNVEIKILFFWSNAYTSTDPTCSYSGTDCVNDNLFDGTNNQKTLRLTMDQVPPSGQYRGTAKFHNADGTYSEISMDWNCDSSKCY